MSVGVFLSLIFLVLGNIEHSFAIGWMALVHSDQRFMNASSIRCKFLRADGLTSYQVRFCKEEKDLMPRVIHAARESIHACQDVFSERRWNCSTINYAPNFLPDLKSGTREQAYVYALSGGSIVATIARACAQGFVSECTCADLPTSKPTGKYKWEGCSDNVDYGMKMSALFTDGKKARRSKSKKTAMNRHNYRAGRKVMAESLRKKCKCHGVSGSCATMTCWMALPEVKEVAKKLKDKYAVAVEVKNSKIRGRGRRNLLPINPRRGMAEDDLIYYTTSPDYCSFEAATGSLGTVGRHCVKDGENGSNCNTMCCGRGFRTYKYTKEERCHCKYIYCCRVKCKTCIRTITVHECL